MHHDEIKEALKAEKPPAPKPTIFSKIIDKSIPAKILYEDDEVTFQIKICTKYQFKDY